MGEFDLIARYFKRPTPRAVLGVGDDCALLAPTSGMHWAVSSDMLVEGRHFLSTVDPRRLGHKALAVNLSDLAACGAEPKSFTLALSLPRIDEAWLEGFSFGLFELAHAHGCELVGGDTTQGPLNICITAFGEVPPRRRLAATKRASRRRHLPQRHRWRCPPSARSLSWHPVSPCQRFRSRSCTHGDTDPARGIRPCPARHRQCSDRYQRWPPRRPRPHLAQFG